MKIMIMSSFSVWVCLSLTLMFGAGLTAPAFADESCTTGDEASLFLPLLAPGQRRAITREGDWVLVKALDDPNNPYADYYGAWDRWFYQHFDSALEFADLPAG